MMSLFAGLKTLLSNNSKNFIIQALAGAGLGVATTAGLTAFVDYYKAQAIANLGQLGAVTGLLSLAGVDRAISIIIGAYLASVYINTFATGLRIVKR